MTNTQLQFIIKMRDQASAQLRQISQTLSGTGRAAAQAAAGLRSAGQAATQAGSQAQRAHGQFDMLQRGMMRFRGVLAGMAGAVAAIGLTVSLGAGVATMARFGDQMSTVAAVSQATDEQFIQLRETALSMGESTRFTAQQAAEGLELLAKAGFDVETSLGALPATLSLAAAGQLELGEAAETMTNIMSSFQLGAEKSAYAADLLAFTAANSNTDVKELGVAMRWAGSASAAFGVSLFESSLVMGALADRGVKASLAGTGLRMVLTKLNAPSADWTAALKRMNLTMADVDTKANGLFPVLKKLKDAGLENDTNTIFKIFGDRGGPTILNLLGNMEKLDELQRRTTVSTKQSANAIDFLTKSGIEFGSRARITQSLNEFTSVSETMRDRMAKVGADMSKFDPSKGLVGSLEALRAADPSAIMAEFGETTGRAINGLIADFDAAGNAVGAYVQDLEGFADRVAFLMDDNLGGALRRALSAFQGFFLRLDQDQDGPLRDFIEMTALVIRYMSGGENAIKGISLVAEQMGWNFERTMEQVKLFANVLKGLGGALAALAIAAGVVVAIVAIGAAIGALLTPVGLAVAAIAGLGAALAIYWDTTTETSAGTATWGDLAVSAFDRAKEVGTAALRALGTWFGGLDERLGLNAGTLQDWGLAALNVTKTVLNGFIAFGRSIVDIFVGSFRVISRLFEDFGREATKELMAPITALQQAGAGDAQGAMVTLMAGGGNFSAVLDGYAEESATVANKVMKNFKDDVVGDVFKNMAATVTREIDIISQGAADSFRQRAVDQALIAEEAFLRASDAVKDIQTQVATANAAGKTGEAAQIQAILDKAVEQAAIAGNAEIGAQIAAEAGNAVEAQKYARMANEAALKAESFIKDGKIPLATALEDPFAPETINTDEGITAKAIAAESAAQKFAESVDKTVTSIQARTAALTQDEATARLWAAAAQMGLDLNNQALFTAEEQAAMTRVKAALDTEALGIAEQQVRQLALQEQYAQAQLALTGLTSQAAAEEAAVLAEKMRLAEANNLTSLEAVVINTDLEASIRRVAAAQYNLANASPTVMEGLRQGWETWSQKVKNVGTSMREIAGQALQDLSSTMTNFLMGQEVSWAQFANSVIAMIAEIIVQLLIMKSIQAALNFFGVPAAAKGAVPGAANPALAGQFAQGSAFANSIVSSPTFFPFAKGGSPRIGLMGEAGPEAIMPLKRLSNGNLGVEASGAGGMGSVILNAPITINMQGSGDPEADRRGAEQAGDVIKKIVDQRFSELMERQARSGLRLGR